MRRVIGRVSRDVLIESVVVASGAATLHRYRLVGGPEHGREFETLSAVGAYVIDTGGTIRLEGDQPS